MTDTNMLKAQIIAKGYTVRTLAAELGWNYMSLYNRLNNKTEFKASEIDSICKVLGIEDKNTYFFAHN